MGLQHEGSVYFHLQVEEKTMALAKDTLTNQQIKLKSLYSEIIMTVMMNDAKKEEHLNRRELRQK